jgi:hypothetical protein
MIHVTKGCLVLFVFVSVLQSSDSITGLIDEDATGNVYSAVKNGERFAIKRVPCNTKDEIKFADNVERTFKLLNASCPYLMSTEESFNDVFFFFFFNFFFLVTFVKVLL